MKLDVSPLISGKVQKLDFDYLLSIDTDAPDAVLPPDGVSLTAPVHVSGTLTDNAGYMELRVVAQAPYVTVCSRCLDEVSGTFSMEFKRIAALAGTLQGEDDDDEYVLIEDGALSFDDVLTEELMLEFPQSFLCREDCAGLCAVCGKRLADGDCGCSQKKEIDPRFKLLQDLLERAKKEEADEKKEEGE